MLVDSGYKDGRNFFTIPTGIHNYQDKQATAARARHETINTFFKKFGCLKQVYRHQRNDHINFFRAYAFIVNLELTDSKVIFQVEFNQIKS